MKLKGITLLGTYKVNFDDEWLEVFDEKGNIIYSEASNGYWVKNEYDEKGNRTYSEDRDGYWVKSVYDDNGDMICYESRDGDWTKGDNYDKQ